MAEASARERLEDVLLAHGPLALAVSGGVDSMTLAHLAHGVLGPDLTVFHAVSPAVPPEATARVRRHGEAAGWRLEIIDAGEFRDPAYLANPVNRCFFCKFNLYGAIRTRSDWQIASGTNLDDLTDYRPGLKAAAEHDVVHPYVEAEVDKAGVRRLARALGLGDLAELPAAPCLSSRLETDLPVTEPALAFVHQVERLVTEELAPETVRCRLRADGVAVELDPASLARIEGPAAAALRGEIVRACQASGHDAPRFLPYRRGSAFRTVPADGA